MDGTGTGTGWNGTRYHTVNIQWSNKFQYRETVMTTHSTPLHSTTVLVCRMSYIPINVNTKKHKHKHKHIYYVNVNVNVNAVKTCVFIPVDACILVLCQKRWNVGILIVYIQCHHATMPLCHYATMPLCHYVMNKILLCKTKTTQNDVPPLVDLI